MKSKIQGLRALTTETGAGQWGSALAIRAHLHPAGRTSTPAACSTTAHLSLRSGASVAPSVGALVNHGDIEARAVKQLETFAAAVQFSKAEGTHALASWASVIPAPESAHAIRVAIDEALQGKLKSEKKVTPALARRCKCRLQPVWPRPHRHTCTPRPA